MKDISKTFAQTAIAGIIGGLFLIVIAGSLATGSAKEKTRRAVR